MQDGIFFATSPGEIPTGGIGGKVKICVNRASKQSLDRSINNTNVIYK